MLARPCTGVRISFLALLWIGSAGVTAQQGPGGNAVARDFERITITAVGLDAQSVRVGSELAFGVQVDGGQAPVNLKLLNPQPGMVFDPVHQLTPPFTCPVRWLVPEEVGERVELVFRVEPGGPATVGSSNLGMTLEVPVPVVRDSGAMVRVGDVTGDGLLDVVAVARLADRGGAVNSGVAHLWVGSALPVGTPTATLELASPGAGDQLGSAADPGLQLLDLDGDGTLDIVIAAQEVDVFGISNAGAVFGFFGGPNLSGTVHPDVTFHRPSPEVNDQLGSMPVLFEDLTGNGVPELLIGSTWADVNGVVDAGGYWVWETGSALLIGGPEPFPLVELTVPGASPGDRLGLASGQGVQVLDVDGDTISDVVIGARLADRSGFANIGAIYVWQGGSQLSSAGQPTLELDHHPTNSPAPGDQLGLVSGQGIQFADVTGDGTLDIIAGARGADADFVVDSGAVYVWRGAPGFVGISSAPWMELTVGGAHPGDELGAGTGQTIQFADLTDDGYLDVVVSAQQAHSGEGRIYVFEGGPFQSGPIPPIAELIGEPDGEALGLLSGQGVCIVDLTGDGELDVVAGSYLADSPSWLDQGRFYVWSGPGSFGGGVTLPDFTLEPPDLGTDGGDRMGDLTGPGMQFFDVTGDGRLDLLTGASNADMGGVFRAGAAYVFEGGSNLGGPAAVLVPPSFETGDQLTRGTGQGIRVHDLTGDGLLDIVVGAEFADDGGLTDVGAFHVWEGGPNLGHSLPLYTLRGDDPYPGDRLGGTTGPSILMADLTGDTIDDIVVGTRWADVFSVTNTGAYYLWDGADLQPGTPQVASTLTTDAVLQGDQLGLATVGMLVFDMTGDSILDLVIGAAFADEQGVVNSGALYLWTGANQLGMAQYPFPDVTFADPSASVGDLLGG